MPKSNKNKRPSKPHPDFPLFPHASRQWAKKVKGKMRYFGSWDDPDAALDKWLEQKDDLLAGREPSVSTEGTTVADICNEFLFHRDEKVKQGELTQRTFDEYKSLLH